MAANFAYAVEFDRPLFVKLDVKNSWRVNANIFLYIPHIVVRSFANFYTSSTAGKKATSSPVSDVGSHVIIRKLLYYSFNILPVFLLGWLIHIRVYLHKTQYATSRKVAGSIPD
jgi:hypothetical protein